jgi:hypothetical protein
VISISVDREIDHRKTLYVTSEEKKSFKRTISLRCITEE